MLLLRFNGKGIMHGRGKGSAYGTGRAYRQIGTGTYMGTGTGIGTICGTADVGTVGSTSSGISKRKIKCLKMATNILHLNKRWLSASRKMERFHEDGGKSGVKTVNKFGQTELCLGFEDHKYSQQSKNITQIFDIIHYSLMYLKGTLLLTVSNSR